MLIIKANGEQSTVDLVHGKKQLKQLQDIVGGYIELVRLPGGDEMYVNEDGRSQKLPPNHAASLLAMRIIVGDVAVCKRGEVK